MVLRYYYFCKVNMNREIAYIKNEIDLLYRNDKIKLIARFKHLVTDVALKQTNTYPSQWFHY